MGVNIFIQFSLSGVYLLAGTGIFLSSPFPTYRGRDAAGREAGDSGHPGAAFPWYPAYPERLSGHGWERRPLAGPRLRCVHGSSRRRLLAARPPLPPTPPGNDAGEAAAHGRLRLHAGRRAHVVRLSPEGADGRFRRSRRGRGRSGAGCRRCWVRSGRRWCRTSSRR